MAKKYNVRDLVRFKHRCVGASWDEARRKWIVKLQKTDEDSSLEIIDEADVLITGTGILNEWKWPNIAGLHSFKGDLVHTAAWDETFDPKVRTGSY